MTRWGGASRKATASSPTARLRAGHQARLRARAAAARRAGAEPRGRVLIGTVEGDQHDIGKNLVAALLEGGGFEVVVLGVALPASRIRPRRCGAPAGHSRAVSLLTTTMPAMSRTVTALADAGLRDQVKVMVGGAPVTRSFAESIGADAYGRTRRPPGGRPALVARGAGGSGAFPMLLEELHAGPVLPRTARSEPSSSARGWRRASAPRRGTSATGARRARWPAPTSRRAARSC
jgi:methylmalonyl-CoA mutase cobalamin-binding subunit